MNLEKIYEKIDLIDDDNYNKASLYYSIIQIKNAQPLTSDIRNSIYIDVKHFIRLYIQSIDNRDLGYDIISIDKIKKAINFCAKTDERYQLSLLAYRLLKTKGFEDESKNSKTFVNETKTKLLCSRPYSFGKYFRIILHLSTYNLLSIVLSILVIVIFSAIIFLPAPFKSWETFKITYHNYSELFSLNHFVNIISNLFAVENDFKVETNSILGILTLIAIKLFYIIFIVNYLYKKVIDFLNGK